MWQLWEEKIIHQKRFEGSVYLYLDLPWGHLKVDLYFSFLFQVPKQLYFPVLGMKTQPWKFLDLAHNAPYVLPALFKHTILRRKTIFLGPLKSSKNMLSKSILIGLFVLKNNRTIREQKSVQEG